MDPQILQRQQSTFNPAILNPEMGAGQRSMAPPAMALSAGAPAQRKEASQSSDKGTTSSPDAKDTNAPVTAGQEPEKKDGGVVQSPVAAEKEGEALSPIRQALVKQFEAFKKAKVGDKQFDQVVTQKEWDNFKAGEEAKQFDNNIDFLFDVGFHDTYVKKYEQDVKDFPAKKKQYQVDLAAWWTSVLAWEKTDHKAPRPVKPVEPKAPIKPILPKQPAKAPVFTTCIATQGKVLQNALADIGHDLVKIDGKTTHAAFAADAPERSAKLGAWTPSKPGTTERPQKGDILVFSMRGFDMDQAAEASSFAHGTMSLQAQSVKKAEKKLAGIRTQMESLDESKKAAAAAKETELVAQLEAAQQKYQAYVATIDAKLEVAREKMLKRSDKLMFSHVSFFVEATKRPMDPDAKGKQAIETWDTFDGGQRVQVGKDSIEGANAAKRTYDPNTNEISGESQQGGKARYLLGWTNVDKLVGEAKKK